MQREIKTIQTPSGHTLVLNTYITGRENRALVNVYLDNGIEVDIDTKNIKGFNAKLADKAQDLAFRTIIVSFDGHRDGDVIDGKPFSLVDAILDLPDGETQFIIKTVNEITADKGIEQKKTL